MYHLKALAKRLGFPAAKVLKDLTIKHRRKFFCKYDGVWYEFKSAGEVIVPYQAASVYALRRKKDLIQPVNIDEIVYDHLTREDHTKVPTAVLLGHFNHGKTTLLDALGGSTFVEEEKHGITQVIRTQLVSGNGSQRATFIDTPGQEIFYRMRSYGASIADLAIIMVAADEGVKLQTEESIGIVEELGIPAVVCINKIDDPSATAAQLAHIRKQLSEYVALENVKIIEISAKKKLNINGLLEALAGIGKTLSESARQHGKSAEQLPSAERTTDRLLLVGSGTVLNILRNRRQGTALHVIVRHGEVQTGDWFSAGGWAGLVRAIEHTRPALQPAAADTNGKKGCKPGKDGKKKASAVKKAIPLPDGLRADYAGPGIAAHLLVTLHDEVNEPRPIGDSVRFHRDKSILRRERKQRELKAANVATAGAQDSTVLTTEDNNDETSPSGILPVSAVRDDGMTIEPRRTRVPEEEFTVAKDAAVYCMERSQFEVRLAEHAVSPEDARRFGLERLCALFDKQKPGFTGKAEVEHIVDIEGSAEGDEGDDEDTDSEEYSDEAEAEEEEEGEEGNEEEYEDIDIEEEGVFAGGRSIIVKADSDVTLGTLTDRYEDCVVALTEAWAEQQQLQQQQQEGTTIDGGAAAEKIPGAGVNRVVHWGIGEIGMKDVNMAKAADAIIVAYNVGVEKAAARQALNVNVKISKFDHIQSAADCIVGVTLPGETQNFPH